MNIFLIFSKTNNKDTDFSGIGRYITLENKQLHAGDYAIIIKRAKLAEWSVGYVGAYTNNEYVGMGTRNCVSFFYKKQYLDSGISFWQRWRSGPYAEHQVQNHIDATAKRGIHSF